MIDAQWRKKKEKERLRRLDTIRPFVDNQLRPHTLRLAAFRSKNRTDVIQAHANTWAQKHEKRRLRRLNSVRGTVDQTLHPSSKLFVSAHGKSEFDPLASHAAKLAKKNERIRLGRLRKVQSTFKTSTLNRLHKSTKEFQKWKANSRKRTGEHANKWEVRHERERLKRLNNTTSSVKTILPTHIQRKREFDMQLLLRKGGHLRPISTRSVHERLKVSGGYLKLLYPPKYFEESSYRNGEWEAEFDKATDSELKDRPPSSYSASPMSGVGVHLPEMKYSTVSLRKQAEQEAKHNLQRKRSIFSKILAKALHRETQRKVRLRGCKSTEERKTLARKFRKERENCQRELVSLMQRSEILSLADEDDKSPSNAPEKILAELERGGRTLAKKALGANAETAG